MWKRAISQIATTHGARAAPLGRYLQEPHQIGQWYISPDAQQLSCRLLDSDVPRWAIFQHQRDPRYKLRSGARFLWSYSSLSRPSFPNYASVKPAGANTVALHSEALPPLVPETSHDFWTVIRGYDNQTLWDNFDCDGDGSWITNG